MRRPYAIGASIALFLCLFCFASPVFGQCPNNNSLAFGNPTDLTPPTVGSTVSNVQVWAGEYVTVNVVSGANYTFSTCIGNSYNTVLSTYDESTGVLQSFNDDFCATQSQINWTAGFSGILRVLIDANPGCASNATNSTIGVTLNSMPSIPEIDVRGNSVSILDGDGSPSLTDHTDFGAVLTCAGSITRTFTIFNTGSGNLTLGGLPKVVLGGANPGDFLVSVQPVSPVLSGGNTSFSVVFNPGLSGIRTATVSIANDDSDENPYNFAIQGTGNADVTDPTITCPATQSLALNGSCQANLPDYTGMATGVSDNCGTPIVTQSPAIGSLQSGVGPLNVSLFATDAALNSHTCTFTVNKTSPEIGLTGNGNAIVDGQTIPSLTNHTDFGAIGVGSPIVRTFTIANSGTNALTIGAGAITVSGTDASMFVVGGITLPASISAAGSTTVTVTFTPTSAGLKTATVNVANNDCDENPYNFAVQGTGNLVAGNRYVDLTAVGANNGTSWANAFTDLQNALASALSGDTVFVAAGTYKPDLAGPGNRSLSFGMKTGVVVLGGFPTGGGTLAQRNWVTNPTILSGDIGTQGVHTDNSYHVVRCNGQQGELNGFIVERGRADGAAPDNDGGGVFVTSGYVASRFCTFRNNFAADQGGGSYHDAGGNPTFRQCKFESNSAAFGGGSYAFASTVIANCGYVGNSATSNGGGVYAVVNINMYNATFKGNSATTSGNAIYYQSGGSNRLYNSIVWGNTGSGTHIAGAGSITLRSCIIEGGCPGGGATCTSILNVNPQFSDVAGHLASNSPAIDAGENTTGDGNSDALTIDLDNLNRNFDAIPGGVTRDMGAYESQALNLSRYYVDHTATGANDGTSWANAFTAFQSAVAIASAGDTVFVAAGTHKPSVGPGYSRTRKFTLVEGVRYYGGFPNGGGTFAQRDFSANRTILSGDIGNAIDSTDNCFTVVDASNLTPATLMSGFTVEEGNADSANVFVIYGRAGGINLAATGSIRLDSVTVRNNYGKTGAGIDGRQPTNWVLRGCTFDNNSNAGAILIEGNATGSMSNCIFTNNVGGVGGAINLNVLTANFTFTNCTFANNRATGGGGGGAISGGNGGCTFTNCSFTNNTATNGPGGAFYKFYSTLNTFNNCTFTGNRAAGGGGAIYGQGGFNLSRCEFRQNLVTTSSNHGGAMYNNGTASTIENCVFWDNRTTSGLGGAIYNNTGGTLTIRNTTFANNHALGFTQGGGINNNSSSNATINNSIFWGNLANNNDVPANSEIGHGSGTLTVTNSIWQGQTPSGTIYNINPLFTNQGTGDLTLTLCSPAIDTGSTAGMPVVDFLGNTRPFNAKPGTLDYDLGAYEFQSSAVDVTPPNAICQNVTVNLNAGGNGTTTAAAVNNGSTDNCAITSLVLNTTAFTCANVGANTVTLTLSDAAGNTSSCNATVTVQDVTPPTALCQNVTVSLDGAGTASLTGAMLNNGSSDICGIASLNPSVTSFTCNNLNSSKLFISDADRVFKTDLLGNNRTNLNPLAAALYTLAVVPSKDSVYIANFNQGKLQRVHLNGGTVTDIKTGVQPFGIAVDHLAGKIYWADPNANTISRCNLDGSGTQIIVSGATDADYSRIIKLDLTNGKMYWTDANLGTVKRANLDGSSIQTIVTGQGNIVGLDLDVAANKLYFSSYSFSQIKRTNLDGTGLTVIVPAAGSVPLGLALDIPAGKIYWVNGSGGNSLRRCDLNGSNQVTLQTGMNLPYDIGLIPAMPVVLTVTDVNANAATCTGFVNVQDLIVPTISCPSNISANTSLGVCSANVTYATPVGTDNCASTTTQTTGLASGAAFPVGVTTNTFSVADGSGNSATCSFTVTVTDNVAPAITCPSNISTSNGVGTLLASYPLQTNLTDATGNFGAATISGNPTPPAAPTPGNGVCHNGIPVQFPNGQNTVTPNIGTLNPANFTLKVDFKLTGYPGTSTGAPVILGGNSWRWLGIWVSQAGQAGVTYNNSNRVYSSTILSLNTWYAGEIRFSANTARLFINHVEVLTVATGALVTNGNLNFTTNHPGNGTALNGCIQNLQIMNGTTPNCGATVYYSTPVGTDNCASTTSRTSGLASGSTFPIGTTTNVFQVTDASGATATCSSTVTVVDTDLPVLTCPSNITGNNDPGLCSKVVAFTAPVGTDNCPGTTTSQTLGLASNAAFPVGTTTNVFQATDAVGNTSTCSFTVTISDNVAPTAACQNITVQLDNAGNASITATAVNNGSADACGIASITVNTNAFVCANVGANPVVLTVTDVNGNTSTCGATVTVEDLVNPVATCQNITVNLDATGNASITGAAVNNGSSDACGIASLTPSPSTFNCTNVSAPPTELFISEYIEGAANNRCLEIYNGTGAPVNLSGYQILIFANGGTLPGPAVALSGTVANGDVHVICHPTAAAPFLAQADQTSILINYNGDDAVVLANGLTRLDVIGVVGEDPGIQWLQTGKSTLDQTIVRNPNVGTGNTALTPGFPSLGTEWTSLGLNNSSNLGMHNSSVGSSNLVLTVTDVNGNTSTCSSSVTVVDAVAPVALCRNITVQLDASGNAPLSGAMIDNGSSDACGLSSLIPNTLFFTCSNLGANSVILTVTDLNGNTATCNSTVTIADTIRPVIACPNGISMGNDLGSCNAVVTFATPAGTDNCTPTNTQLSGLASGAAFPVGTTTNTYLVTDAAGNTATCSFTVVISDNELPTITCPANITGTNDPGLCSKVVTFTAPVGTDNCPSAITTQTAGLPSGAAFPVGTTTNAYLVTDAAGNTATCSFTAIISDNQLPTITCPANITGNNDPGLCSKVVTFTAPVGSDNCAGPSTSQTAGLASGAAFPVGTTTNVFRVTDAAGNSATCSFTVVISDNQLPTISCPANITGNNDPGLCSKVVTFSAPVGADNCAGSTTTQTAGLASGAAFPVGTTTNTFRATDAAGNTATCSFTVSISDNELPTITCPANITGTNDPGLCSKVVTFTAPVGGDNCAGQITTQIAGLPSGSAFPVGITTNVYRVTDVAGNSASCSFTVTISDTQLPTITCPANITGNNDPGLCSKVVTFSAPVGADNCAGPTTTQTAGLSSGAAFPVGTTTNAFLVTDAAGNTATCSFTVIISDNQLPTITCPVNITGNNDLGLCSKVVTFSAPVGADNCAGPTTTQTAGLASGSAFPVGTTTNAFLVTDAAGNTATCSFTVIISDNELPTITCPANISGNNDPGLCSKVVTFSSPVGADNCAGPTTTQTAGLASGAAFPVGTTTNVFRVTDAAGNTATCSFTVVISDNELPTITCPANITGNNDPGLCSKVVTFTAPVGADNCAGPTTTQTAGLASGAAFPVGTTTNAYLVTDAAGNTATCSFTVIISDNQLPTITCPANIMGNNDPGLCSKVVTFSAPVGADNCAGPTTTQVAGLPSGSAFPVGTTTNAYLVTDAAGNTATCSFTVVISDNELPTITCPANITGNNDNGLCSKVVTFSTPIGSDNCPGANSVQVGGLVSGASFPVGTTTNSFVVTDASGNSVSCSFTVVITDNQSPTWSGCPSNVILVADTMTCSMTHTWNAPSPGDECGISSVTTTHNPGSVFTVGATTVVYTATDLSGNSTTCSFVVTVNPVPLVTNLIVTEAGCYNITCHGDSTGSVFAQVNGGCLPYTYLWSNGATTASLVGLGAGSYTLTVTDANGTTAILGATLTEPAPLTAVISGTPIVCAGDSSASLMVTTAGGNDCAAYQLLWSTGDTTTSLSGLPSGAYTVTLSDSLGCMVTDSWTVQSEALPVINIGPDTMMCPGINMVLTGPSGFASYQWTNGPGIITTITQPGTYWLDVQSALGCAGSDTIVVGEHVVDNNLITADGPLTICEDVALTLTALPGQVNYLWNTGSTNPVIVVLNAGGPFWVHAEDANGCIAKDTVIVNFQPFINPNPQIIPGPAAFLCQGTSLVLDAQSGYFSYNWSNGATTQTITVTSPGSFSVVVANGFGCTKTSPTVVVTEVPNPEPPIANNSGTLSTDPYASYQWMLNGSNIFGAVWPTLQPQQAGWYQVAVVDANGCHGISDSLFVSLVGMGDAAEGLSGLALYPNPTSGMVHLLSDMPIETPVEVEVWDMFGRKVKVFNFSHLRTEAELDLTDIARATYTVKVKTTRRQPELQAIFKLVIQ